MLRYVWNTLWNTLALLTAPGIRHYVVTPSDDDYLDPRPRAIVLTDSGDITMEDERGNVVLYEGLGAFTRLDFSPVRILQTGTTVKFGSIIAWA